MNRDKGTDNYKYNDNNKYNNKGQGSRLEEQLSSLLTEGHMEEEQPEQAAPHQLSPRYEIHVRAERDPIAEETEIIRAIAEEVDDRYDKY